MFYLSLQFLFSFFSWTRKAYTASLIIQWSTDFYYVYSFLGGDAMFGDAEHYKYLTNEADLNNANDDSIALTPKTPKRVELCFYY